MGRVFKRIILIRTGVAYVMFVKGVNTGRKEVVGGECRSQCM